METDSVACSGKRQRQSHARATGPDEPDRAGGLCGYRLRMVDGVAGFTRANKSCGDFARLLNPPLLRDTGGSLLLTYWPSEFSQIRGQLRRTRYGEGLTANELVFQFMFSMGAHGAHPF